VSEPLKFGILGCSRIARRRYLPALAGCPATRAVALGSRRPGAARAWADEFGVPRAYDSYEAVIDDPEVEVVYIATTGALHHAWTLRALQAGKHVLCEKSLAMSLQQAEEMCAAARERGLLLQEAFMWRHHPRTLRAHEIVRSGEIGRLLFITAHFTFTIDVEDWRLDAAEGGGAAWDIGCYCVNAARLFAGREPELLASRGRWNARGADLGLAVSLGFPEDLTAQLHFSFEAPSRAAVELVGTDGFIRLPDAFGPPDPGELIVQRGAGRDAKPERETFPGVDQFAEELGNFAASVAEGTLRFPAEDGLANMRVLARALERARTV